MSRSGEPAIEVRPFHVDFPEEELADLRRRIEATRWPEKETVEDDSQGVPLPMIHSLARYWATDCDWRRCEEKLNALPQFMTFKQVEYTRYMTARPQTLYGIADSPVGLAAWLLDHNDADGQPAAGVVSTGPRAPPAN
jgi:hypothetical protein